MIRTRPGYFERWARNRKLVARVRSHLEAGGRVTIATYTRATTYSPRHASLFYSTPTGALVKTGARAVDFSGAAVRFD